MINQSPVDRVEKILQTNVICIYCIYSGSFVGRKQYKTAAARRAAPSRSNKTSMHAVCSAVLGRYERVGMGIHRIANATVDRHPGPHIRANDNKRKRHGAVETRYGAPRKAVQRKGV